jgi:hypothetical protein
MTIHDSGPFHHQRYRNAAQERTVS